MKRLIYLSVFAMVVASLYYFFLSDKKRFRQKDNTNFAIENVDKVDRVVMKDREGNSVDLKLKNGEWYVNGDQKVFAPKISVFLNKTLKNIRVKGPVAKTARNNIIRSMVGKAVHVQIYENGEIIRDYYVGKETPSHDASYLHMAGAKTPYVGHIFGHLGILYPQFGTEEKDWYDMSVFDYESEDITQIEVVNNELPQESFVLKREGDNYELTPPIPNFIEGAAKSYVKLFKFRNYEGFADYLDQKSKDSIKLATPFLQIKVTDKNGETKELNLHRKGPGSDVNTLVDKRGNTILEDTERYFATFTGFPYLVTVQEYTFGKLIVKRSFFGIPSDGN